ncbi:MAG: hypothetical protein ABIG39_04355 [Candidatus Micrarchaeota archaeon]
MRFVVLVALVMCISLTNALWYHTANILVDDEKHRPIPHARVIMQWQLSESDQQHEQIGYTNYMGIYTVNMTNYVQLESSVNYKVKATAEYGAGSLLRQTSKTFNVKGHADPFALTLPLHRVKINLFTTYDWPVGGALIYIAPWTLESDTSGAASFILPTTKVSIVAVLGGVRTQEKISVNGDSEFNITMELYRLTIHVVDQDGNPRGAKLYTLNKSFPTDSKGIVRFNPFPGDIADITVKSGDLELFAEIDVDTDTEEWLVFDVAAPQINDTFRTNAEDEKKAITAVVGDAGKYASGLDSVTLFWSVNDVQQEPIEMYPADAVTFRTTLPAQPPSTTVSYFIQAVDKQGNTLSSKMESYTVPPIQTGGGNQTGGGGFIDLGGINWWFIIGGLFVLIVVIVIYIYWRGE